jgi:4-aminobutyrate aminotransferase/(S)-3-amino-2-methylpropionate transaminase
VDGNRYIDLGSFFGAALVGHRNPHVTEAVRTQAGRLLHCMGDVHPAGVKARFLSAMAGRLPAPDYKAVLSLNGSDAVECALKFAGAATGRAGIIAFEGAYHGLTAGALEVTHNPAFREPFACTLTGRGVFVPFPAADGSDMVEILEMIRNTARTCKTPLGRIGAVIVEPIQGRGGIRVPPAGFLAALARLASEEGLVLVSDEIYTGGGRTGTFLAGDAEGIVPDAICLGKAIGGGVPVSGCWMRPALADAVKGLPFEAVHTSTFLGHPLGCAAGIGVLKALDRGRLMAAAPRIDNQVRGRVEQWRKRHAFLGDVRGRGAFLGIPIIHPDSTLGGRIVARALRRGVLLLTEGPAADVLAVMPPLTMTSRDLEQALDRLERALDDAVAEGSAND